MEAALLDGPCAVIKTGMLVNEDVVDVIAEQADRLGTSTALIVDPVLLSSSGRSLLSSAGRSHLIEQLLARAALVTPNVPEAQELTGLKIQDASGMSRLADHLLALGASAVLIKGGHLLHPDDGQEEVVDLLRTMDGDEVRFSRPRIFGPSFRGTGCCLASAIAAGVAEGLTLAAAVEGARDYLQRILETSSPARSFRGLLHRPPSAFGQV
jgi:hydroxymethylpyrimidine/phosphomethylpyrimidine kinase